jgi:uncharacterized protein YqjF (DUF2071 family)
MTHNEIDRESPRRRPEGIVVMRQDWHHLGFLHWEVPIDALRKLVPERLSLDTFQGKAYIGLIPFTVLNSRPLFTPSIPGVSDFHEVNVRTYVHLDGNDPGVFFFSLDAASILAVEGGRAFYRLPYLPATIEMTAPEGGPVLLDSRRELPDNPGNCHVTYTPEGPVYEAAPGTLDFFLLERYVLYAHDGGRLHKARVHHPPYPVQRARVDRLEETLIFAAGIRRGPERPIAHYVRKVEVEIFPPELMVE